MRVFDSVLAAVAIAATLLATITLLFLGMTSAADNLQLARNNNVYQVFFHLKRMHSEEEIDKAFWDIATPGNARYRQHLNKQQLKELHAAPKAVISQARNYLETEMGCNKVEQLETDDVLICTLDKRVKESMKAHAAVDGSFQSVPVENIRVTYTDKLPQQIRKLVRGAIAYRAALPKAQRTKTQKQKAQEKNVGFAGMTQTPVTINNRYKVPASSEFPQLDRSTVAAVGEFEGQYFVPSSNVDFARKYHLAEYNIEVMGSNSPGPSGQVEGTLDLQYIGSVFNNTLPILWAEGGMNNNQPGQLDFTSWITKLLARSTIPSVVSISWGLALTFETDADVFADNDAFRKGGLAGMTILVASGDSGTGDRRDAFKCKRFISAWPSGSSMVTSVGATYADSMSSPEASVTWSGGGFSDILGRPSYQEEAVANYLRNAPQLPKASLFNASGRAYPDVSALGTNFNINVNGQFELVSGTSAASPTFAGVLSLIAAERAAQGKPRLGFLNPTIYKLGKVGNDVTEGYNQDENCIPGVPIRGFSATKGWDPVTGLGTPDYQFLRANL